MRSVRRCLSWWRRRQASSPSLGSSRCGTEDGSKSIDHPPAGNRSASHAPSAGGNKVPGNSWSRPNAPTSPSATGRAAAISAWKCRWRAPRHKRCSPCCGCRRPGRGASGSRRRAPSSKAGCCETPDRSRARTGRRKTRFFLTLQTLKHQAIDLSGDRREGDDAAVEQGDSNPWARLQVRHCKARRFPKIAR